MRDLDAGQQAALALDATRPVYLIECNAFGIDLASSNGQWEYDAYLYRGADVAVTGMADWTKARIRLTATAERIERMTLPDWRSDACKIWLLPIAADGSQEARILLLDGVLTAAAIVGAALEIEVSHRALLRRWSPRVRIAPPICNHLPAPGTQLRWQGDNYTLEARESWQ